LGGFVGGLDVEVDSTIAGPDGVIGKSGTGVIGEVGESVLGGDGVVLRNFPICKRGLGVKARQRSYEKDGYQYDFHCFLGLGFWVLRWFLLVS